MGMCHHVQSSHGLTPPLLRRPSSARLQLQAQQSFGSKTRRSCLGRRRVNVRAESDSSGTTQGDEDLEAAMEEFLRRQAEKESGGKVAVAPVKEVVGAESVTDEESKRYCREIVKVLKQLKENRDMSLAEVKLTISIEDPSRREQKEYMGIEDEGGASRDDMAAALVEVSEGRIPKDRIALRELYKELIQWPFLDAEEQASPSTSSPYEAVTDTGAQGSKVAGWRATQARPKMMGRDKNEEPQSILDTLPDWFGYGLLYFVSVIPVLIASSVIAILFFNSLR